MCPTPSPVDFRLRESLMLLSGARPPSAIVTGVHELVGLMRAVRQLGMAIPRDLSIIAFGDSDLAELLRPAIALLRWDAAELGRHAAQLLLRRIAGDTSAVERLLTLTEVLPRESCVPPRRRLKPAGQRVILPPGAEVFQGRG